MKATIKTKDELEEVDGDFGMVIVGTDTEEGYDTKIRSTMMSDEEVTYLLATMMSIVYEKNPRLVDIATHLFQDRLSKN